MKTITLPCKTIEPSKIVCIGRNYIEHIKELGNETPENMVVFLKPNSAISHKLFCFNESTRYEGEICFEIEQNKIRAVGFGLDLTKAKTQNYLKEKGLPWERAKAFDKSAVFGNFVYLEDDIESINMELFINDVLVQKATYDLMIYKPNIMINEILSFMSLEDGDIIMSGTPKGVGTYNKGDVFVGKIYSNSKLLTSDRFVAL